MGPRAGSVGTIGSCQDYKWESARVRLERICFVLRIESVWQTKACQPYWNYNREWQYAGILVLLVVQTNQ